MRPRSMIYNPATLAEAEPIKSLIASRSVDGPK
jgi:hypothetical protein